LPSAEFLPFAEFLLGAGFLPSAEFLLDANVSVLFFGAYILVYFSAFFLSMCQ
jgi:hypothetical protein